MCIKKRLLALAGMPVLSLLTSVVMAGEAPIPDPSEYSTAVAGIVIKDQSGCPAGTTFFKNVYPSLTNGTPGGETTIDFTVDGKIVPMTVTWHEDNSFDFVISGGFARKVGVTVDTNNYVYDYTGLLLPDGTVSGASDSRLNYYGGEMAADVNHLDLCLATLDTESPEVTIISPAGGATVSGIVSIIATVTDNDALLDVTATVDGASLAGPVTLDGPDLNSLGQYVWTWDTSQYDTGLYTITVTATDQSVLVNKTEVTVTVEVVKFIGSCLGQIGPEDFDDPTADIWGGGCNPSGYVTVQAAPDYNHDCAAYDDPNEPCSIGGELLEADDTTACGPGAFPDPRMEYDDATGRWVPWDIRDLVVFYELGGTPDIPTGFIPASVDDHALVLDKYTYGYQGCFGVVMHYKNFLLRQAYPYWPQNPQTGLVFVKTVFPEDDWATPTRPVAKCYGEDGNFDLQESAEFAYQTDDKALMIEGTATPLTNRCGSGRTLTRDKSFEVFNVIETAGIDFDSPTGRDDVLEFKYQIAAEKFQALFAVLANAEPTLLTGRFSSVTSKVNQAKRQFENGTAASLDRAMGDLRDASDQIKAGTTWDVQEDNWPGDALGRIENLIYRLGLLKAELERP